MAAKRHHFSLETPNRIPDASGYAPLPAPVSDEAVFGYPRDFLDNRFVYIVVSPRARGLSVGVNLNPVVKCNFRCVYCEIDRTQAARAPQLDIDCLGAELSRTLELARSGRLRERPRYAKLPADLLQLRHVALSGDGEPTLSSHFIEAVQAVAHVRALSGPPFFKIVLLTNSTALDEPRVQQGLKLLTREDEIWAKLDGGTQEYLAKVNGSTVPIETILNNLLLVGRQRPLVIQSLFPAIKGEPPSPGEIGEYARRLKELKDAGAQISLVQIYSATRPMARVGGGHLPLKALSEIARTVRQVSGLHAEVF